MSPDQTSAPDASPDIASDSAPASDVMLAAATPAADSGEIVVTADNIDALLEQAEQAAAASIAETPAAPTTADARTQPPAEPERAADDPTADEPQLEMSSSAAIEALKARGYEVTPPAPPPPPPDPYATLHAQLEPLVGTAEQYQAARLAALAPLPPLPGDTDPDWQAKFDAHAHAVAQRDYAAAQLAQYDHARGTAGIAREWARDRVLGELGAALAALPAVYGLSPEQAARVQQPRTMTDVVAAVVEARDAYWQQQLAEQTKHWQGEVKRAAADRQTARLDAIGRGASPGAPAAGRPADARWGPILAGTGRPEDLTEEMIAEMGRGGLRALTQR